MNLIDRDEFITELNNTQIEFDEYYKGLGKAKSLLIEQPIVDAKPIVYGQWEQINVQPYFRKHYYNSDVCCSICHVRGNIKYNYCPNCGAKMKKETMNG